MVLSENTLFPAYLKTLMKKIAIAGLQYSLFLVEELQKTSGNWSEILPEEIRSMEVIFDKDREILTQFLLRITDKKRYMHREYEELLHNLLTEYADLPNELKKELVNCLLLLIRIYDFLNKYQQSEKPEDEETLESYFLEVESMDTKEAESQLTEKLKKRGLLLV